MHLSKICEFNRSMCKKFIKYFKEILNEDNSSKNRLDAIIFVHIGVSECSEYIIFYCTSIESALIKMREFNIVTIEGE